MKTRTIPAFALLLGCTMAQAADWRVCATADTDASCSLRGYPGIQQAVEGAASGDRVVLGPGVYHPEAYFDVPSGELVIRGGALVTDKALELIGEPGAILDGSQGPPVSALLIHKSNVQISGLEIRNFRLDQAEDDLYDGHGIFIIDSKVEITGTTFGHIPKMSVSVFGDSTVKLVRSRVLNGHVGIWAEGTAAVRIENSLFSANDSAGVAAYDHTTTEIHNSVFERSMDDGVFAKENALIRVVNSIFVGNQPYAVRAEGQAFISVDYCAFHDNESLFFPESDSTHLDAGEHILLSDPELDSDYRPGNSRYSSQGDPAIRNRDGTVSDIGLFGGPSAPEGGQ